MTGKVVRKWIWTSLAILALLGGLAAGWLNQPLKLAQEGAELSIEPGTSPRSVAQAVADAGVDVSPAWLYAWFRLSGQSRQIRAGSYELRGAISPRRLLAMLVRGDEALRSVTLVEGWTLRQVRQALSKAEQLTPTTQAMAPEIIMQQLGRAGTAPEGRFFPDTYSYSKGSSDLAVLARALRAMDQHLAQVWAERAPDLPLRSPDDLLTLASIVEKETARSADRDRVAAVFINRLRVGMPLQTDPTVIYGLGPGFDGNLRKRDLLADTPWNTYTRAGLPPTPIAMPGRAALHAAAHPAASRALYFVARGDGSSEFSDNLDAHNRAVARYQLRR